MIACLRNSIIIISFVLLGACAEKVQHQSLEQADSMMPMRKEFFQDFIVGHSTAWSYLLDACGHTEEGKITRQKIALAIEVCVADSDEKRHLLELHEKVKSEVLERNVKAMQRGIPLRCEDPRAVKAAAEKVNSTFGKPIDCKDYQLK